MLYNYLIFFLGFYSWDFKPNNWFESLINSKFVIELHPPPLKNNKKLIDYLENNTNSPWNTPCISFVIEEEININKRIKIYSYQFYSFLIFLLLFIQPLYLIICAFTKLDNFENYLISFLCHINTPINYLWAKYYYRYNHCLKFYINSNNCKNCDKFLITILIGSFLSIVFNLIFKSSFLNNYNSYYYFFNNQNNNMNMFIYIFSIFEWIYARSLYTLTASSFTIVFCNHVNELINFKYKFDKNKFEMENNYCLTKMITTIASLRHSIEQSIDYYNNIISFITTTGTLSIGIFIRHNLMFKFNDLSDINIEDNNIYIIQNFLIFMCFQFIFFINIYRYSRLIVSINKRLQSSDFINHFLTRWTVSKVKSKCNKTTHKINSENEILTVNKEFVQTQDEILYNTKILICIDEENATTLDWFVLDKLINVKWMDFKVMGISFDDGELIKKTIALSSILLVLFGYI